MRHKRTAKSENLISIGFGSRFGSHGCIVIVGSPCRGERRGPSAFGKTLNRSLKESIKVEIIDIDRLDSQRFQTRARLDGTQFQTRYQRREFYGSLFQCMAVGGSLRREHSLRAIERHLPDGTVSPGSVAFRILGRKGFGSLVLVGSRDGMNNVLKLILRKCPGRHRNTARVYDNRYGCRLSDLLETLLPRLDLGIGPGISHKIFTGIHQVNRNVFVKRHDGTGILQVLDRVGIRSARKRHGEIGLAPNSRTVRLGILVTSRQQDQRGQEAKAFIHFFHSSFSKNPGKDKT